jgi:hypothetical protein
MLQPQGVERRGVWLRSFHPAGNLPTGREPDTRLSRMEGIFKIANGDAAGKNETRLAFPGGDITLYRAFENDAGSFGQIGCRGTRQEIPDLVLYAGRKRGQDLMDNGCCLLLRKRLAGAGYAGFVTLPV